jgi:hypothetical protein
MKYLPKKQKTELNNFSHEKVSSLQFLADLAFTDNLDGGQQQSFLWQ